MNVLQDALSTLIASYDPSVGSDAVFRGRQFDLGLAWVHHPVGEGGLGLEASYQKDVDAALAEIGVTPNIWRSGVGIPLAAPTIATYGTTQQRNRFLRPTFTGEESWCQLFSEPGAGSDLATLGTRAIKDGDEWVVNGQKVWNSLAHLARWGLLIARTDTDVPKHTGLTYFVVDMTQPGVEVRPLRQITGEAEFFEVYLTDHRIPDSMRLGDEGSGWSVALSTLSHERTIMTDVGRRGEGTVAHLIDAWRREGHENPERLDHVLRLAVEAEVLRVTIARASEQETGGTPSEAWSFVKLMSTDLAQRILDETLTLTGPGALTYDSYEMRLAEPNPESLMSYDDPRVGFIHSRSLTIAGGTSEIQRSIIADRVLKLPREPQADKNVPWSKIPKS